MFSKKQIAEIISYIFHPIVIFILMPFFVIYRQTGSILSALKWEFFSSIFIFFFSLIFLFGRYRGFFSDQDLSKREERPRFYFLIWLLTYSYLVLALILKGIFFPLAIIAFGIAFGITVFAVVNNFMKPSIHTAVAVAFVLTITALYGQTAFLITFWIIPLVVWARIFLKKHTLKEVFVGGIIGIIVVLLTFIASKYLYLN